MSIVEAHITQRIGTLKQEIQMVREEMDRQDGFDTHMYELRKKLMGLQKEIEQYQKLLQGFEQTA